MLLWDAQVRYEIPYEANASGARFWLTGTRFTLGILNLFDEEPTLITNGRGYYNNYQDPRQRYIYLSVKKSL